MNGNNLVFIGNVIFYKGVSKHIASFDNNSNAVRLYVISHQCNGN